MDDDVDSGDVNDGNWEDNDEEPQHRSSFVLLGRDHDGGLRNNVEAVGGCDSRTDRSEVCDACCLFMGLRLEYKCGGEWQCVNT